MSSYQIIIGRERVIRIAEKQIKKMTSELKEIIKGAKSEYLFHMVSLYPNIFSSLAKNAIKEEQARKEWTCNKNWLRATTGLTLALNAILPDFIPLKPHSKLSIKKLERTFEKDYLRFVSIFYDIGPWKYFLENKKIDKIVKEGRTGYTYYSEDKVQIFGKYVDKLFASEDYLLWFDIVHKNLPNDIKETISEKLKAYGFGLEELIPASLYLERIVKENKLFVPKNEIHAVFTKNIRHGKADRLVKALTFEKGKDLYKAPLIPAKGGYIIAGWILSPLNMLFDSWIRPILEYNYSKFANFVGRLFEEYVRNKIKNKVDIVKPNVVISEHEYPEIKPWLVKLGKREKFEIDLLAIKGPFALIISCKGGKKELPKQIISRLMAEIPERDILDRIDKNKKETREIEMECDCISSNKTLLNDFGLIGKEIIPVVVYAFPQPLCLPEMREIYNFKSSVKILTFSELEKILDDLK